MLTRFRHSEEFSTMGFLFDVSENRVDDVRKRLQLHPDDVRLTDANGNGALHLAAEKGLKYVH